MLADTIAYYAGSAIKGPKIFPKISPNKTYSGSIIGLLGGVAGALIVYAMFEVANLPVNNVVLFSNVLEHPILFYAFMGLSIGIVSEIGDLFASRVKRELEIKDFSHALGSHGGIMDRLDSIIFAVLFVAIVMEFLPIC
jgi:phosphatidate cytidylyltransferase